MALRILATFTKNAGEPATMLSYADIDLYLISVRKSDLAISQIWTGSNHPTTELPSVGMYAASYGSEDLDTYDYVAMAHYTGTDTLDADYITGKISQDVSDATILAALIAGITEGSLDLQDMLRIMYAAMAGKSDGGGGTTLHFRDSADSTNRITATVDANGNRTAISVDPD